MTKKQKLELTWVGKENRPRLEPRILIEDTDKSYHAAKRVRANDIFDNVLIRGDNLLALKALETDYTGKVKCIYIDPPFNTGSAFEHYDDGVEHSTWLSLMRDRFQIFFNLLSNDGVLAVHLDDCECAYAKVLLDEIFGRYNYLNTVTTTTNAPSGFKSTSTKIFSTANYILFYAKDKNTAPLKRVSIPKAYDAAYSKFLINPEDEFGLWRWTSVSDQYAVSIGYENSRKAKKDLGDEFDKGVAKFAIANADRVFRTAAIGGGAAIKRKATIQSSKISRDIVVQHPNEDVEGFYILNGEQLLFYSGRLVEIDGEMLPAEIITDVWTDIGWTGIAKEGAVEFKNGKKPEALVRRVIQMCTEPGDLVLDSFGGSGTTGAVAHKMGRRWIMIELGDHCDTHIVPRLVGVIEGSDQSGVSKAERWAGGGGFRYYNLAPSLLEKDKWGREVISKEYNAEMLAQALCKLEGFTYAPNPDVYWQQGHSSENDFLYVTTQSLGPEELAALSEDVGEGRSLLILCAAFRGNPDHWPNLTVKKIPNHIRSRCEWGHDDYSLNVANLPMAEAPESPPVAAQGGLFDEGDAA